MNINFNINYGVNPGEYICLNIPQGNGVAVHKMLQIGDKWLFELRINDAGQRQYGSQPFDYYYTLQTDDKILRQEWTTQAHRLDLGQTGVQQYTIYDTWIEIPHDSYLYSSAFTQCINRREKTTRYRRTSPTILRLKVRAPQLRGDEKLILTGIQYWENGIPQGAYHALNKLRTNGYVTLMPNTPLEKIWNISSLPFVPIPISL